MNYSVKTDYNADPTVSLARLLIQKASITPNDKGCQDILIKRLQQLGFNIEPLRYSDENGTVDNFWARLGDQAPCFCFAGHTDVVAPGNAEDWHYPPFAAECENGFLHGRGAADMKLSLAAFITSIESFLAEHAKFRGSIALLITSDEEGPATCGTRKVIETLQRREEHIDYCLVGEPSSVDRLGDTIKNGRRGSMSAQLHIHGIQGHVAYPHLAENPIHYLGKLIQQLLSIEWDQGNQHFPPTSLQMTHIGANTKTGNVIPGSAELHFNLRFSTEQTPQKIEQRIAKAIDELGVSYAIHWTVFGHPFLTPDGELVEACRAALNSQLQIETELSTAGGTSDGRFIAPTGAQVVELGPINASIHQVNERVALSSAPQLSAVYKNVLENLLL